MKLTLKNLQQETFTIELEPTDTVQKLKETIEKEKGSDYPVASQKLIYAGKIMADADALSTYNVDEKKFIVVMVAKAKPAPAAAPAAAPATPAASAEKKTEEKMDTSEKKEDEKKPAAAEEEKKETEKDSSSSSPTPATPATGSSSAGSAPSGGPVMGEEYNSMVQNIMAMGYDKDQVRHQAQRGRI